MEWENYVKGILSEKDALDELRVSTNGGVGQTQFPPVIRASVRILDKILESGCKRNIFVFPEKQHMLFLFMLAKVIHNLTDGKIGKNYDPSLFTPGQKVKLGDAVAEFLSAGEYDGKQGVWLRLSDLKRYFCPVDILPVMQRVKTKKPLSKDAKFSQERKRIKGLMSTFGSDSVLLNLVSHKSHLEQSIAYVSSVSASKAIMNDSILDDHNIQDVLLVGQANYEGVIKNISAGQLDGYPALVLASDLFAANEAAAMGHPFQSMIIDISNIHQALSQLDALDNAIALKIPLLCITDTPDAFDLAEYKKRGFKIWRWDSVSLTADLIPGEGFLDSRLRNCLNHSIHYCNISDPVLSECMMRLSRQKHNVAEQSSDIIKLYDQLTDLTFRALRETKRFGHRQTEEAGRVYETCKKMKLSESPFVPPEMAADLNSAADILKEVYSNSSQLPKNQAMREWFAQNANGKKICIIVPENEDRQRIREYWNLVCFSAKLNCEISVYFPTGYCSAPITRFDTTIVIGWMRREVMRKVIFSYATRNYEVFLYECERRWKNSEERSWAKAVATSDNQEIIRKTLSRAKSEISVTKWENDRRYLPDGDTEDLTELEQVLRDNKFRQYTKGTEGYGSVKVRAIPVSFIGGYVSFYRLEHKVLQVTNILNRISDKIRVLKPESLEEGDFVIVREADQDLIREMADKALAAEGKTGLRELSGKWREPISIELVFSTREEVYKKLKKAGCKKSMITFNNWVDDEDMIAPQDKEDLRIIADAFDNETLRELLDKVYDAAKEVRKAHTQAGMQLSKLLQVKIAQELKEESITDIYNIWDPITVEVEGVGNVKLLKIIDIESEVEIESSMTNRLLSE